jgi:hypothetical protein
MKISIVCFLSAIGFLIGCNKASDQTDCGWTSPTVVTSSKDSLVGGVNVYKWHDTIIVLQGMDDRSARCFLMGRNSNSWSEVSLLGVPRGDYYWAEPDMDQTNDRVAFEQGYMEDNQLKMGVLLGDLTVSGNVVVQNGMERKWQEDKKALFGETDTNVSLNGPWKRNWPRLGVGVIKGSDIYLPYCVNGETLTSGGFVNSPFNNGVFHSGDSGITWQKEQIGSSFEAEEPSVFSTKSYYYYFATRGLNNGYELWFSRKPVESGTWDEPKPITKTYATVFGSYVAVAAGDTVHLCWMDCRHNKWRFNIDMPNVENDDIVYCHRKDSDSDWSKNVILSKGVLYSYPPSMSAEGDKIVVAWAGIPTAGKWHTDNDPNDVYYVTSKDGGKTWTKPLKVTDGVKDGMTAGHPQVMLLNGVIHLFYIQGKMDLQQVGGLTKLNQPPWPIYYTQRPFPN